MSHQFAKIAFSERVKEEQTKHGSRRQYARMEAMSAGESLSDVERDFIESRDHFFMASVGETGWPYVQHRGGPKGFLKVMDDRTIAFADFSGNKQYISTGNLKGNDRVALILMDYPRQARMKILGRVELNETDRALMEAVSIPGYKARVERVMLIHVEGFDWNCPQHITPRFTVEELEPLRKRLEELEFENAELRKRIM